MRAATAAGVSDCAASCWLAAGCNNHCRCLCMPQAMGLPVCLFDLNLSQEAGEKLDIVAAACVAKGNLCLNMPMPLTAEEIKAAILATDAAGRAAKE